MRKTLRGVFVVLFVLLLVGSCSSPTEPGPPVQAAVSLEPGSALVATQGTQRFSARGGDGNFNWTLPEGGGEIKQLLPSLVDVIGGNTAGRFRVVTTSAGKSAEASFEVVNQYELEFVSANPAIGSELIVGTPIRFRFRYVTLRQPATFFVKLLHENREGAFGSANGQRVEHTNGMGYAECVTTTTTPGETKYIRAMLTAGSEVFFQIEMEAPYTWK